MNITNVFLKVAEENNLRMKKYQLKRALTAFLALLMFLGATSYSLLTLDSRVQAQDAVRVLNSESGEYTPQTATDENKHIYVNIAN